MSHVSIIKHPTHKLNLPAFICDHTLKDDVPVPFNTLVSGYRFVVLTGRPQSGKTSLLVSLLTDKKVLKKAFHHILVVMPLSSRNSLKKNIFKDLPPNQFFDDMENFHQILKMIGEFAEQEESTLLILDDVQTYLKRSDVSNMLNHLVSNRRHMRCSIICCLQNYNLLPLKSRKLINILIVWRPTRKEWANIADEALDYDQDTIDKVYKIAFPKDDNVHRWLLIDLATQKIFSEFTEIIVSDD